MIILIDGPEKAGKSTLIKALVSELGARVRPWGPISPDDRVYTPFLKEDALTEDWVIWDRGWPSEHVYGKLLGRDRRLANDPFLGEWLHGRTVQTRGVRCMLVPWDYSETARRTDDTDLKVDRFEECYSFAKYAETYGYLRLTNFYNDQSLETNTKIVVAETKKPRRLIPPAYAGPQDAEVVFVGEARNDDAKHPIPGAWLPFTSKLTMELGRRLGNKAFQYGWTNVGDVPLNFLSDKLVIACGEQAEKWLRGTGITHVVIPHPAWMYRFTTSQTLDAREHTDKILNRLGEKKNDC